MVAQQLKNLSDTDLMLMEDILGREFAKENEQNQLSITKNGYAKPMERSRRILACMNAVRSQRQLMQKMSIKW